MISRTLFNVGWRYLFRHPWQTVLMIVGITLGVAVVVAVDLANASASRAFDLSTETIAGRATHQIVGGPQGLDESLYSALRRAGVVEAAAPVITEYVSSPQMGDLPLQLLGIDPFSEAPFRDYLGSRAGGAADTRPAPVVGDLTTFLTQPGAVLISRDLADRYNLQPCGGAPGKPEIEPICQIELEIGGQRAQAFLAGLLDPADSLSRRALDGLILTDISTAQELTSSLGRIDHIDLILPEVPENRSSRAYPALLERLPEEARLQEVEARTGTVQEMTAAFRLNLTALSLLALVVGMFLIYNTMTFSVVQRRPLFGTLRCLGVTRQEVFFLVVSEALAAGFIGSTLGLALGVLLGQGAVRLVTQTVNDLFFAVTVQGVQIPISSLFKGGLLGIAATLLTAAPPAWEAASVPPRAALSRSGLEAKASRAVRIAAFLGLILLASGGALLGIPGGSLVTSFGGTFAVIVGCAMLAPLTTRWLMRLAVPVLGRVWGILGRMAPRDVINSLSRTSIAIAALMVAVSVTIGVSLMVSSFRYTVIEWLGQILQGDIYISAPAPSGAETPPPILPDVLAAFEEWPGVDRVLVLRSVNVDSPLGPVHIAASSNPDVSAERSYLTLDVPLPELKARMQAGAVIVSEPFANRVGLPRHGGLVTLQSAAGPQDFPVVGIYYDYSSTQGTVTMLLDVYRRHWNDPEINAAALMLAPGVEIDPLIRSLQEAVTSQQRLIIRPNRELRQEVLVVFDRTFAITGALQLLATVVAFIGVLSALLSLELERQRELGILRAIGLTVRQLWNLILLETGLLGTVAGLLSMPTGFVLALILIYIINRRSFGWTLQLQVDPLPFVQALAVAVIAALLAGIYPAHRIGKMITSEALRSE